MTYKCLSQQRFKKDAYEIIPIRQEDMRAIKDWRNAQIDILRQAEPLNDEMQKKYWDHTLSPSFVENQPKQILFSYLYEGKCIGYGGLTHIDWTSKRAEVSFLLETERGKDPERYLSEFCQFLELLKECAFGPLGFHRLFAETFNIRPVHVEALEKSGFILEGVLLDHVKIGDRYCDSLIHGLLNEEAS